MIKPCKVILGRILELSDNTETKLIVEDGLIATYEPINVRKTKDCSDYASELNAILQQLDKDEYIYLNQKLFNLTIKGLRPRAIGWDRFKSFFLTSILTPIIVAIITTLITLWLAS